MTRHEREAVRAMLEWLDNHVDSLAQALASMAEHNTHDAAQLQVAAPVVARVLRESAASWSQRRETLLRLYSELPDRDVF